MHRAPTAAGQIPVVLSSSTYNVMIPIRQAYSSR